MHNVLAVGVATIDVINVVNRYPASNEKIRALKHYIQRGGNSCNTLAVLSQLGHDCHWLGTLATDQFAKTIREDLNFYDINYSAAVVHQNSISPLSCITVDKASGTRSIVHARDLPELEFDDFKALDLSLFDWIHFEGRNIEQTRLMLEYITRSPFNPVLSLEVEKNRPGIASLIPYPDVIMFSSDYVQGQSCASAKAYLQAQFDSQVHRAMLCAWGDEGAWGIDALGCYHSPALKLEMVDPNGAGDAFNAGIIGAMLDDKSLGACLDLACAIAAKKCCSRGFSIIE